MITGYPKDEKEVKNLLEQKINEMKKIKEKIIILINKMEILETEIKILCPAKKLNTTIDGRIIDDNYINSLKYYKD
jgi:hypothetical protein